MKALDEDIARFARDEDSPFRFEGQFDPETGLHTTRFHVMRKPDWTDWALRLGDAVHNARSALDLAVWQLVRLNGQNPKAFRTQFPIESSGTNYWCQTKDGRPSARERCLKGVAEDHRAIIDAAQPYRGPHPAKHHALSHLAYLSNVDKHQVIHVGFFAFRGITAQDVTAHVHRDVGEQILVESVEGPFEDDADIIWTKFEITGPTRAWT